MKFSALPALVACVGILATASALGQVSSRSILTHRGSGLQHGHDHDFAMAAAVFNKFSVIAGQLAMIEARDAKLKEFAELMVEDYTAALSRLRSIAGNAKVALPAMIGPDDFYGAKMASVRNRTGAAFDRAYCRHQMDALQSAEALLQSYAGSDGDTHLRSWAAKMLRLVRKHQRELGEIVRNGSEPSR